MVLKMTAKSKIDLAAGSKLDAIGEEMRIPRDTFETRFGRQGFEPDVIYRKRLLLALVTRTVHIDDAMQKRLRVLRLWHWEKALQARREMDDQFMVSNSRDAYNFHMAAVQTLNDFFSIGDTAERDAAK